VERGTLLELSDWAEGARPTAFWVLSRRCRWWRAMRRGGWGRSAAAVRPWAD